MPGYGTTTQGRYGSTWTQKPGWIGAVARFWQRSYAPEYLGLAMLIAIYIVLATFALPFHRMFSIDDLSKSFPHALHERVPAAWMFGIGSGVPGATIIMWIIVTRPGVHRSHIPLLGLLISLMLTLFFTDVVKNAVGRPRPDLIDRCKPAEDTPTHKLVSIEVCTAPNDNTLQDGWRSFPSGHSSFAFAGLGYFSLFIAGQTHVFRPRSDLARVLLFLAPLVAASWIALSRLEDYRHDALDVSCGTFLGMSTAFFCYRRHYPPLRSSNCHEPYPGPWETAGDGWNGGRSKDDAEPGHRRPSSHSLDGDLEETETYPLNDLRRS